MKLIKATLLSMLIATASFADEAKILAKALLKYPKLKLKSICSHLAATNNPKKDDFTNKQLLFNQSKSDDHSMYPLFFACTNLDF